MSTARAVQNSHVPSIIPWLNPLIRRLIGAGLPFGPNVLITIRGRSSGVDRTFPIALLELNGRRYVQSPFGEVNWVQNLRAAGEATVTKGRTRETLEAIEVPPEQAGPILRDGLMPYMRLPFGGTFVRHFFHLGTESTLEDFVAEAHQHPTFELRPRAGDQAD